MGSLPQNSSISSPKMNVISWTTDRLQAKAFCVDKSTAWQSLDMKMDSSGKPGGISVADNL